MDVKPGKMDLAMKVGSLVILPQDRVVLSMPMVMSTMASGSPISVKDMVFILIVMVLGTKGNGMMINNTDEVKKPGRTTHPTKAITK